ncbi:Calmodulin-binding transcription activator 3 [Linum grandiflorum]
MFGEVEVAAEVIADGVLRCYNPLLGAGRIPFYVTCSNRTACSEVREFEFRDSIVQDLDGTNSCCSAIENIRVRFGKLLCTSLNLNPSNASEIDISQLSSKMRALLEKDGDEWDSMLKEFSAEKAKEQLLEKLLKDKLHDWLLQKVVEGGKGPCVLDEDGQGVLHLAAALGYDWAFEPTTVAGVKIDFRDVNGWTALHWAASYGRERTVACLINLGGSPGALTDPTPRNPTCITPADLASANGHKGIAGFLAEFALTSHFTTLAVDKQKLDVQMHSETPTGNVDSPLKDSLAAVRNATQAAASIHQVFRVQSFQKKKVKEHGDGKLRISDEQALSLINTKGNKNAPVEASAVRIQNKFRSWKGRTAFLVLRQQIVKIQAHVRGYQVRKNYKKILWSVGIVEKVILRWRRKRSGLRGFKPELLEQHSDDYDFFKQGRKQTEERSQIALARVKSMVRYPEARDQYHRLRNEIKGTKSVLLDSGSEATQTEFSNIIDRESVLDDDTFMPTASNLMKKH